MRVLVEPSDYLIRNIGDTAMTIIALERLSKLWPDARIQVLTEEPDRMPRPGPNIEALLIAGRELWLRRTWLQERRTWYNRAFVSLLRRLRLFLRRSHPKLAYRALCRWGGLNAEEIAQLTAFFDAISKADLLLVTGMGGLTSAFTPYAFELLEVVNCAQCLGAKTVMMGQGLGPIEIKELDRATSAILRRLHLLGLREKRAGLPLLKRLNVPLEHVVVTGDDAIEFACRPTRVAMGYGIGVNLRKSYYADVNSRNVQAVGPVLHQLSNRIGVPLIGVPISRVPGEEDAITIAELIQNSDKEAGDLSQICLPEEVVAQLQRCRVLVAGSYHAGVFALASGIPTVALVNSPYYVDKFLGLADMFGCGCRVVELGERDFENRLTEAVIETWASAEQVREPLLEAAQRQLQQSQAAYAKLKELLV
jgi:polysaccharide pyruvyl transferase WcaK-like protein